MKLSKAYLKALLPYWSLRSFHAARKYREAMAATKSPVAVSEPHGPTVLVFSSLGIFSDHVMVDYLLAQHLRSAGARVVVLLCDEQLPICHVADRYSYAGTFGRAHRTSRQKTICRNCVSATRTLVAESGIRYVGFSEGRRRAVAGYDDRPSVDVSDDVKAGIVRFAASSHPDQIRTLPQDVIEAYEAGGVESLRIIEGLFETYEPDVVVAHHGIYLPQGIVQRVAKARSVTFYSWHFGYRKSTLIFSRGDTYHRELTQDQPLAFCDRLTPEQRQRIYDYLQSRWSGGGDWIHFNRAPKSLEGGGNKAFVLYTSVDWDAALHFPASIYSSQFDFLDHVVEAFRKRPQFDLIIRVHPAEVTGFHPASLSVRDFMKKRDIPPNIQIIGAENKASSYELATRSIAAIVYNTKLGIELPVMRVPVIVAGDCWIRGKGFSYDMENRSDLERFIDMHDALQVTDEQRERALEFAHYFYFRRCIDTPELTSSGPKFQVEISQAGLESARLRGTGFTFIAQRILERQDVIQK